LILALLCWTPGLVLSVSPAFAAFINWDGSEDTSWADGDNWVGDAVPGPADVAGFDDDTSGNSCVVDESVDVLGITLDNYTGTLDLGDTAEDIQIGTSGFLVDEGTVDMGTADVTITGGPFDYAQVSGGSWTAGTGSVTVVGTCPVTGVVGNTLHHLRLYASGAGNTLVELDGVFTITTLELENAGTGLVTLDNSTNGPTINCVELTIDINSTGDVKIDNAGVQVDITITGDVVDQANTDTDFVYLKGTGTITALGTSAQD
ncbi:unnamed protein product, partial [marine sediment metagenome]